MVSESKLAVALAAFKDEEGLLRVKDFENYIPKEAIISTREAANGTTRTTHDFRVLINQRSIRLMYNVDKDEEGKVVAEGFTKLSWNAVAREYNLNAVGITQDIVKIEDEKSIIIPEWDSLAEAGQFVFDMRNGGLMYQDRDVNRIDLGVLLMWLTALNGFSPIIEEYMCNPDTVVKVDSEEWLENVVKRNKVDQNKELKPVTLRHQATAYMLLMMIYKSLTVTAKNEALVENQCKEFVIRRAKAMLLSNGKATDFLEGELMVPAEVLWRIPTLTSCLPKLKSVIVSGMIVSNSPICDHALTILTNSSASVYSFVVDMVESDIITKLQFQQAYLMGIIEFWKNHMKLVEDYGNSWRYYKCINPLGQRTSMTKYGHLGSMAVSWMSVHNTSSKDTLNNIEGHLIKPKYVDLAKQRMIGQGAIAEYQAAGDLLEIIRAMGIPMKVNFDYIKDINLNAAEHYIEEI